MKQEETVDKIMTVLLKEEIITVDQAEDLAPFFLQSWGVGYDVGRMAHIQLRPVVQLTLEGKEIHVFESIKQASNKTETHSREIAKVANGTRRSAKGFKWRFLDQYSKQ